MRFVAHTGTRDAPDVKQAQGFPWNKAHLCTTTAPLLSFSTEKALLAKHP